MVASNREYLLTRVTLQKTVTLVAISHKMCNDFSVADIRILICLERTSDSTGGEWA